MEPVTPSTRRPRALRLTAVPVGIGLALVVFACFGERSTRIPETQAAAIAQLEQRLKGVEAERAEQRQFATVQAASLRESLASQERELGDLDDLIALQRERAASAERIARRHAELLERHFVSQFDADQKSAESRKQQLRLRKLSRGRTQLERDIKSHRQELATTEISARERLYEIERETLALVEERAIGPLQSVTTRM